MVELSTIIPGNIHQDDRGTLCFFNDFDLSKIKRFYVIEPASTEIVRAWQGHQFEEKWFYVLEGSFKIVLVKPDNWQHPSLDLPVEDYKLSPDKIQILHVPAGYANGFQALESKSKIMVFSSFTVSESVKDDFRFDKSMWYEW